jgi:pyruvate-formate lyase
MSTETSTTRVLKKACRPSTPRTQKLKQVYMGHKPTLCADRSVLVTESYKETEALPPVLRQALAFDRVLSWMPIWIQDGELQAKGGLSLPGV